MYGNWEKIDFKIPKQDIKKNITWQLSYEDLKSREVAKPLFDTGVHSIAMVHKKEYPKQGVQKSEQHLFMILVQGELHLQIENNHFVLKPGMLGFCPKNWKFLRWSDEPSWWIYINLFDKPVWDSLKYPGSYIRKYESTEHFFLLLSRILESRQKQTIKDRLNALEYSRALADLIKREARIFEKNPNPHLDKLKRLAARIHLSPESPWTVPLMAKNVHLSPRSLNRLFHREYGMGPMDYVINKRLNRAFEMLVYTDDKIEAVASTLGYKSLNSFSNLFLRHIGVRPGAFRNKYATEK